MDGPDADCFTGQRANAHFFYGRENSFGGFKPCYLSNTYRYRTDFRRFEYEKDPMIYMSACRPGCEDPGWMFSTRIVDAEDTNTKTDGLTAKTPLLKPHLQLDVEFLSVTGIQVFGNQRAAVNIYTISKDLTKALSPKTWTFATGTPEGKVCAIDQDGLAQKMSCQSLVATCDDPSDIINISVNTAGSFEVFQKTCAELYTSMAANQKKITDKFASTETDPGERLIFYENIGLDAGNEWEKMGEW